MIPLVYRVFLTGEPVLNYKYFCNALIQRQALKITTNTELIHIQVNVLNIQRHERDINEIQICPWPSLTLKT